MPKLSQQHRGTAAPVLKPQHPTSSGIPEKDQVRYMALTEQGTCRQHRFKRGQGMTNEVPANNKAVDAAGNLCMNGTGALGVDRDRRKNLSWFPMLPGVLVTRGWGGLLQLGGASHHREGAATASHSVSSTPGPL